MKKSRFLAALAVVLGLGGWAASPDAYAVKSQNEAVYSVANCPNSIQYVCVKKPLGEYKYSWSEGSSGDDPASSNQCQGYYYIQGTKPLQTPDSQHCSYGAW